MFTSVDFPVLTCTQVSVSPRTYGTTTIAPVPCDAQVASAVLDVSKAYTDKFTSGPLVSTILNIPPIDCRLQVISCILSKGKVYVTGIATEEAGSRQVQVYSLEEGKWSTLPEAPNYNAPVAIINGYVTLIGGRLTKDDTITDILSSWIEEEARWMKRVPNMPTVRLASGVCHHDNLLLVTGGVVHEKENVVNAVVVYNFSTKCWSTPKALELPKALRSHHLVVFEENIYVMGGATTYPAPPEGKEQHFNPEAWRARWSDVKAAVAQSSKRKSVWTPITAPPFLRPTVVSYRNSLFSVGGVKDGVPKKDIYEFQNGEIADGKVDNCWKPVGNMRVGKYRHGVVPLESRGAALFVAGGYVQGDPKKDETNEKSSFVEIVLL